jgi:uncharacterized protein YndB with AHSA1/START domain
MSPVSTSHHTVVVKRTFDAPRAKVFGAWSDPKALVRWYVPGDASWSSRIVAHDFRVGGLKQIVFGPGGTSFTEDCRYEDIVPEQRLCFSMTIAQEGKRITTSMVTVLFADRGKRTETTVTDQLVILDGGDTAGDRERGWGETLDKLTALLAG